MGGKQSKTTTSSSAGADSKKEDDVVGSKETTTTTNAVSYKSKKCINIHTYLATSSKSPKSPRPSSPSSDPPSLLSAAAAAAASSWTANNKTNYEATPRATTTNNNNNNNSTASFGAYQLCKRRPGCTGMFWRSHPNGKIPLESNSHWPRDGATLWGKPETVNGDQWLLCAAVMQEDNRNKKKEWKQAPRGACMPFEYDRHYYLKACTPPSLPSFPE